MPRPLVAVTATTEIIRGAARVRVNSAYLEAIEAAGLIPLVTPPLHDPSLAADLLHRVDGLVLTGGEDVDPRHYGALRHSATEPPHSARDAWELALVAAARHVAMPVLAICRGMQLLNVALGGTLVQDLPTDRPGPVSHSQASGRAERVHAAAVEEGSRLAGAMGATTIAVNSSHHQAIDRVATGLRVVARSGDGVIEGVESADDGWWLLGAQWHPEELIGTLEPWDRNLFAAYASEVHRAAMAARARTLPRRRAV
jgi:putative glutamine amidotransferase